MPIQKKILKQILTAAKIPQAKDFDKMEKVRSYPNVYFPAKELAAYPLKDGYRKKYSKAYWNSFGDAWAASVVRPALTQQDIDVVPEEEKGLKKFQQPYVGDQDYTTDLWVPTTFSKKLARYLGLWAPDGLLGKIFRDMKKKYPNNIIK